MSGRIAILVLALGIAATAAAAADGITITDVKGRQVEIPRTVERVACLTGACYEKVFLLGQADKIAARAATYPPWMFQTNPNAKTIPTFSAPNTEDLMSRRVEVAFAFDRPQQLDALAAAGIAAVVATAPVVDDEAAFAESVRREVRFYAEVLGAKAAAETWCTDFDRRLATVAGRMATLAAKDRPRVYYLRGPDAQTTHGRDSNIRWYGEMAGGDMGLSRQARPGIVQLTIEEIVLWNPEVIFVGRQYAPTLVTQDPRWRDVAAVKNGRVYTIPDGVFFWDSSSEGGLLMEFMAKILHPDRFADLDLAAEVKGYYRQFYHYSISDDEVGKLLHGDGPDGRRVNPAGN